MATMGETGGEGSAVSSSLRGCLMPAMRSCFDGGALVEKRDKNKSDGN